MNGLIPLVLMSIASIVSPMSYRLRIGAVVRDGYTGLDIPYAKVSVMDSSGLTVCDSLQRIENPYSDEPDRYLYTSTFTVDSVRNSYIFRVNADGYGSRTLDATSYWLNDSTAGVYVEEIEMFLAGRTKTLEEVTVTASKVKMVMKGDTLVYDATAFRLSEGSMLDELIRTLPGTNLSESGQITVNGKFVSELLVNGRNFFKGDPTVALANLPAYTVSKINVYDKKENPADVSEEHIVMDVALKREYAHGLISNYEFGGGSALRGGWNSRWLGRIFAMYYSPISSLAVYANANNLNAENRPGYQGRWIENVMTSGLRTVKSAGINHSRTWKEQRSEIDNSLTVTRRNSQNEVSTYHEAYLEDSSIYNNNHLKSETGETALEFNNDFKQDFDKGYYNTGLRTWYEHNAADDIIEASESDNNTSKIYLRQKKSTVKGDKYGASLWVHTYLNLGQTIPASFRTWNLRLNGSCRGSSRLNSITDFIVYPDKVSDNISRIYRESLPVNSHNINFEAFSIRTPFNITKRSTCYYNIGYLLGYTYQSGRREMDYMAESPNSNDLWLRDLANSYFTTESGISNKIDFSGGIDGPVKLQLHLTENILTRRIKDRRVTTLFVDKTNLLLSGSLIASLGKGEWSEGSNYKLSLNYSEEAPKMLHLLPIVDTSDPVLRFCGNPELRKSILSSAEFVFNNNQSLHNRQIVVSTKYSRTDRLITSARFYNRQNGITTIMPYNIDGNFIATIHGSYSQYLDKSERVYLSNFLKGELLRSADYSTDSDVPNVLKVNNWQIINDFEIKWTPGNATISGKVNFNWNRLVSLDRVFTPFYFMHVNYGVSASVPMSWGIDIKTEIMAYTRHGYAEKAMNSTDWVWNLQLSKTFGSAKQWTVKAIGFDLLQQLPTIRQEVNAQGRTETRYNSQPSYAMLTLTYRLDIKPQKK